MHGHRRCRPILQPDTERLRLSTGEPERAAAPALEGVEPLRFDIADGEVGEPCLPRRPGGLSNRHLRSESRAEKSELKAESPARGCFQVSRVIPPFGTEVGMRAVIGGEVKFPWSQGASVALIIRGVQGFGNGYGGAKGAWVLRPSNEIDGAKHRGEDEGQS